MNKMETPFTRIDVDMPKKARNLLIALELAILEVEIEQERIKDGLLKLGLPDNFPRATDRSKAQRLIDDEFIGEKLMADIHLWLIAWGSINRILRNLRKNIDDTKLDWIQERRSRWFLTIRNARNSLEHIDERVLKSSRISPVEDMGLDLHHKHRITVFGTKINLDDSSFNKIANLKKDLHRWHSNLPAIWDEMEKKHGWKITKP